MPTTSSATTPAAPRLPSEERAPLRDLALVVVALTGIVFVQPLLDSTGRAPEFFVAHRAIGFDLILIALLVGVLPPLVLAAVTLVAARIHRRTGEVVFVAITLLLTGAGLRPVADRLGLVPWALGTLLVAGAIVLAVLRLPPARRFLRWCALAPLLSAVLFLTASPTAPLLTLVADPHGASAATEDTSVVVLIYDEFPLASLLDGDGEIDERLFPNFAALASDGRWYREATTPHGMTNGAVPAMLTGRAPDGEDLPSYTEHPDNLFTLLAGTHDLHVTETITHLCPPTLCAEVEPRTDRLGAVFTDLRVVAGHVLLPAPFSERLPDLDSSWSGFGSQLRNANAQQKQEMQEAFAQHPIGQADALAAAIEAGGEPSLHALHVLLPHYPWRFLPSGQQYPTAEKIPAREGSGWRDDSWLMAQAYQRHVLQVAAADQALGLVLDRLEATGRYDETMLVVAADHGIDLRPGIDNRRALHPDNLGEIASVPLFVKYPADRDVSGMSDAPVELTDVVPTVAEVLGIEEPYRMDGRSLLDASSTRARTVQQTSGATLPIEPRVLAQQREAAAERWRSALGEPDSLDDLYAVGPLGDLVGAPADALTPHPDPAVRVRLDLPRVYTTVDPGGPVVPALVTGTVAGVTDEPVWVAVVVDGRVAAVGRSFADEDDPRLVRVEALVDPDRFAPGDNDVQLVPLDPDAHRT